MKEKSRNQMPAMEGNVLSFQGKDWSEIRFLDNMLQDALIKHLLGSIPFGMADFGEVMEVLLHLKSNDELVWAEQWSAMARQLQAKAEKSEKNAHPVSASSAYLRASTYWRAALMYFSDADSNWMQDYSRASEACYEKYLSLSSYPGERINIPYEGDYLPGYFYRSPVAAEHAPLLILTPGRDTFAEDTRWVYDNALKRGIHCLVYDGPGQGSTLRLKGLPFRPDWEAVITPVISYALTFTGIDPSRIALMGMSFGGFLIPRAAAFDKRVKLCIVDPGTISWGAGISERLRLVKARFGEDIPPEMQILIADYAWKHGVDSSIDAVVKELNRYDNADILEDITCTMLVLDGTAEITPGTAIRFFDALQCPKQYLLFDAQTTAQNHTQMGGYAAAAEILFDKIEELL